MTLFLTHSSSFRHDTGAHPENARRLAAIERALALQDEAGLVRLDAPAATREQLLRVHASSHIDRIESFALQGGGMLDVDTIMVPDSWEAALHAAGAGVDAAVRLLDGEQATAFCSVRPPGHHAERAKPMGFCLFNNAAVAATHAIADCGAERVFILDWDVHHGNGTEAIFARSSEVFYSSIHEWPLYPGTGAADYAGEGEGEGYTLNLPVAEGTGSEQFLSLVQNIVVPAAREFEPGLLIISAGYDAHRDDPLALCEVDTETYGEMTASMRELSRELEVPLLMILEGGYSPLALASSVLASLDALESEAAPRRAALAAAEPHLSRLREAGRVPS